jgi:hypothetical protein
MKSTVAIPETHESTRRLIRRDEILRICAMSKSKLYRLMTAGEFPRQARKENGTTSALWFFDGALTYIESLRISPAPKPKEMVRATPTATRLPVTTQIRSDLTAPSARSKSKPYLLKSRPHRDGSESRLVVRELSIDAQTVYYEPATWRPFAVVGQLPALQHGQESEGIVGCALHMRKGARL